MKQPLWTPSLQFCADSAHFWSGGLIVHVFGLRMDLWAAWSILIAWAFLKEWLVDPRLEGSPVLWEGLWDLAGYLLGGAFGTLLLLGWKT